MIVLELLSRFLGRTKLVRCLLRSPPDNMLSLVGLSKNAFFNEAV